MQNSPTVTRGDHCNSFIEDQVAHSHYGSAGDVVRAQLRLLDPYQAKLAALCEGEKSGAAAHFDLAEFIRRKCGVDG